VFQGVLENVPVGDPVNVLEDAPAKPGTQTVAQSTRVPTRVLTSITDEDAIHLKASVDRALHVEAGREPFQLSL